MQEKKNIFQEQIQEIVEEHLLYMDEPMKKHTTFRIGGVADYYVQIQNINVLCKVLELCQSCDMPYYVIGNGSNLLVGDKGYRGVIIELGNQFNEVECQGDIVIAQSGALLSKIAKVVAERELAGFEFAAGIPGTVGGAIVMNAGAYGGEMKDVVVSATVLSPTGRVVELNAQELELGYRTSSIEKYGAIVIGVTLKLTKGNATSIQERMNELKEQRVSKQPLNLPSGGSTFKRPEGYFAAKLIDDSQLRGYQVGGAQVSEKHCGFVVNVGNATAADVMNLVADVQKKVREQQGVELELEIKKIGEF